QFWNYPTMSRILQEFGVFQSPLELKALVQEITGNTGSTVPYKDFTMVMLGRRSTMSAQHHGMIAENPTLPGSSHLVPNLRLQGWRHQEYSQLHTTQ
uniref:EF-hand domain-containing protein n=1 Tax=Terrapene triunguis TaxID=2587831 RepID=A0A674K9E4_9SAUR